MLNKDIIKIIQISDTHLFADNDLDIFNVKSNITFERVMNKIIKEDIRDADLILLTGDISQDGTVESYQKIVYHLSRLNIPVYWIPGNHDDAYHISKVFHGAKNFKRETILSLLNWNLIFLNTKVDGRDDGQLSQLELNILKNELTSLHLAKQIAIVMHHHPIPVGTPLIDNYILRNAKDFWDIITGTQVQLIICGHVHGDYQFQCNKIMLETAPATCLQWRKGTKNLKIDRKIGYKVYYLKKIGYKAESKMWQ